MYAKKFLATASAFVLLLTGIAASGVHVIKADNVVLPVSSDMTYEKYLQLVGEQPETTKEIVIKGDSFVSSSGEGFEAVEEYNGQANVICWNESGGTVDYVFEVEEPGFYIFKLNYCPIVEKSTDIRFRLTIDDNVPFSGADSYVFPLIWKDQTEISRDNLGNDVRPLQIQNPRFIEREFVNTEATYDDPFQFYFTAGSHKISLTCTNGSVAVAKISLTPPEKLKSYEQVKKDYENNEYLHADAEPIKIQAEKTLEKSSIALYPSSYQNDPGVKPADPSKQRLNTIGGSNWSDNGQWISWSVEVPEAGLYALQFKALQNFAIGRSVSRTLYIDGEIPFDEAKNIQFDYAGDWYIKALGDDEPWLFYLTQGEHEIRLEVSLGEIAPIVRSLEEILLELNSIYRRIIMITSVSPDTSRDYNLQTEIPDLIDRLMKASTALQNNISSFEQFFGSSGTEISTIKAMQIQLDEFVDRPRDIPARLSSYKDNVSSLGSILNDLQLQPLMLDYIRVVSPEEVAPKANAPFWENFLFGIKAFFASFVSDYSGFQETEDGTYLDVWIGAEVTIGRDQADVLKRLIDNRFRPQYGVSVHLSLVSGTLVQATLAGKGPDIALMLTQDTPVNLAMRDALVDLSKFPEYETIKQRFYPQALIPYEYNGGVYALPETQGFLMQFYRKDVFEELGLSVPKTWEEFYQVMAILQKYNMEVGIGESTTIFDTLLYQYGGSLYNDDRTATNLKSSAAVDAFKHWTNLYTQYDLSRSFDFFNRFRTGEMPLSLQTVSMYNTLVVTAPELTGLWAMAPLPGVVDENGNINNIGVASGQCCVIIKGTENEQAAFDFLNWWTSEEVQKDFGIEIESILGISGRYYTANIEAFNQLPWEAEVLEVITEQWRNTTCIPQIPGDYYVSRCITNAFRKVCDHNKNPREQLFKYDNEINLEIKRKRQEYGLE